jgi:transcriptional regulator with XRE-family HTH domain
MDVRYASSFGRWLQGELKRRGLNQQEFADLVRKSRPTISKWLSGRETPSSDAINDIAEVLHADPTKISSLIATGPAIFGRFTIPERDVHDLLIEIQDRIPPEAPVSEDPYFDDTTVMGRAFLPYQPLDATPRSYYEAFITADEFMEPVIMPGDLVIMDMNADIEPGDIVAGDVGGYYPNRREVMRVVERAGGGRELRSDRDGYTAPFPDGRIICKVVTAVRDFSHRPSNQQSLFADYHAWFREVAIRQRQKREERDRNERRRKSAVL